MKPVQTKSTQDPSVTRPETGTQTSPRVSKLFRNDEPYPEVRSNDRSVHRLYHHYYEDLLM